MTGQIFPYISDIEVTSGTTLFQLGEYEPVLTWTGEQTYGTSGSMYTVTVTERVPNMEPLLQEMYDIKITLLFMFFFILVFGFFKVMLPFAKKYFNNSND